MPITQSKTYKELYRSFLTFFFMLSNADLILYLRRFADYGERWNWVYLSWAGLNLTQLLQFLHHLRHPYQQGFLHDSFKTSFYNHIYFFSVSFAKFLCYKRNNRTSCHAVSWSYLGALWPNYREVSHNPKQEVLQLSKVIRTDAPGLINQKHDVCFHSATHWDTFSV